MKVWTDINTFSASRRTVVTIGNFDGVHLGHRVVIDRLLCRAKEFDAESTVVTFSPHPRKVLDVDAENLKIITSLDEKLRLFESLGVDNVVVIRFTKEFSELSSEDFVRHYIVEKLNPALILMGYDHHFGKSRDGNYDSLKALSEVYHFHIERMEEQVLNDITVSSTVIRKAFQEGDIRRGNAFLGHSYSVEGTVVHGAAVGRTIGFRTANLDIAKEYQLVERHGVYKTLVEIDGRCYKSMTYIGTRPTLNDGRPQSVEVFIFDFNDDLYEKKMRLIFLDFLREEKKFSSLSELECQLVKDAEIAQL